MSPRLVIAAALVLLAAGCGTTGHTPVPTVLTITGPSTIYGVGKTSQLGATQRLSDNSLKTVTDQVTWTSSNPSVVTISSSGLLTATGIGSATISASYQSRSASRTVSVQALVVKGLRITFPSVFTAAGQTQQLTATATFTDGSTQDVTSSAQWSSRDRSIIDVAAGGVASSSALGVAAVVASYGGWTASLSIPVTPPGTIATTGRVRLPGSGNGEGLGVPDFTVTNSVTEVSVQSDARGYYNMGGLASGTHLIFTKSDFETAEMVPTGTFSSVTVQRLIRITAGDSAAVSITEFDTEYVLGGFDCVNCRLVRVVSASAGTLHLHATSTKTTAQLSIWANGGLQGATTDIPVDAGETVVYVRLVSGATSGSPVSITLATSLALPASR